MKRIWRELVFGLLAILTATSLLMTVTVEARADSNEARISRNSEKLNKKELLLIKQADDYQANLSKTDGPHRTFWLITGLGLGTISLTGLVFDTFRKRK